MKKLILYIALLLPVLLNSQDYQHITEIVYERNNLSTINFVKKTIIENNQQELALNFTNSVTYFKEYENINIRKFESLKEKHRLDELDPNNSSVCSQLKSYTDKYNSEVKRANMLSVMVTTAKLSLQMCQGNAYNNGNCSSSQNNYNRQVALYNEAIYSAESYHKKAESYQDRCNEVVVDLKRKHDRYKSEENDLMWQVKKEFDDNKFNYNSYIFKLKELFSDKLCPYEERYDNGNVKISAFTMLNSKDFNGKFTSYYENGEMESEGKLKNGQRTGFWTLYYDNGKLKNKSNYYQGKLQGDYEAFYENGNTSQIGKVMMEEKDGLWLSYFESGEIYDSCYYKNNKRNGHISTYFKNGNLYEQGIYRNEDTRIGLWVTHYKNGNLKKEVVYSEIGLKNGSYKYYYENGGISNDGIYVHGQREGVFREFNETSGNILTIKTYVNGRQQGETEHYDEQGNLIVK